MIMPRRELSVTGYLIVAAIANLMLVACAHNDLDRFYEESLSVYGQVEAEHSERVARWREERDRRNLESGPAAPIPPYPLRAHPRVITERRMQLMEQKLVQSLDAQCGRGEVECRLRALRRLGFECTGSTPVMCSLRNTAYGENHTIIKGAYEHHVWTVKIASNEPNSAMTVHAELAGEQR